MAPPPNLFNNLNTVPARSGSERRERGVSRHDLYILVSLSIMSLVIALEANIIVTALSAIVQDIGGNSNQAFWIGTSYLVTCAACMPFTSSASDVFGRPRILFLSTFLFTVGTGVCCLSGNIGVLIAGRTIQGIGSGGMYVLTLVIFTDIVPLPQRPRLYGIIQMAWAIGSLSGPIIGGAIAENTTWRWIFYLNFPICGYCLIVIPVLLPLRAPVVGFRQGLARIDWIGGIIFTFSVIAILIGISWGGNRFPWVGPQTLLPIILGTLGITFTVYFEWKVSACPFLKVVLFSNRTSIVTYILGLLQGLILYGQLYYVPLFFISVKGYSPLVAGTSMLPVSACLLPGSIISGILVTRYNAYRWSIWLGWSLTAIASGLLIYWSVETPTYLWVITLIVGGLGHGLVLNAQTFVTGAVAAAHHSGHAATMYLFFRMLGTAIGVNLGSSVYQSFMASQLREKGLPESIAFHSEEYLTTLKNLPDGEYRSSVLVSYASGFKGVHLIFTSLAGMAFLLSFLVGHYDLNKNSEGDHQLQPQQLAPPMSRDGDSWVGSS
ncbi:major facilitator superfamily transporter, partial [Colletotrichum scovillei]